MIRNRKKIIIPVLVLGLAISTIGCSERAELKEVVELESQKESIDESLLVKSLDNLKDFEAESWMRDGRVIGVRNQPINSEDYSRAKISIYNPETKLFEDLIEGKEKEWLFIGEYSVDEKEMIYLSLLEGDFQKDMYDFYILNLETNEKTKLVSNMTASSDLKDNYLYIAQGMKLYRYSFGNKLEEIELPKELIKKMNDFTEFEFEDYLEMYYKNETVEGKRRNIIKLNYEYSKKNNAIKMLTNYRNEVMINSSNGKTFVFNIIDKSYFCRDDIESKFSNEEAKDVPKNINITKVEKEFLDNDRRILWKLDEDGNRELKIDELYLYSNVQVSPDKNKVAYNTENENGVQSSYVYDLNTDEKIKIYPETVGNIFWNKNSKEFFIKGRELLDNNMKENITSLIKLN